MTFTTPCFVRVENPEKRKELIEWLCGIGRPHRKVIPLDVFPFIVAYDGWHDNVSMESLKVYQEKIPGLIDCGENIELFKALAAMNYENYREQWFVEEGRMFKCTSDKINNYSYNWLTTRKATAEEIVEYFKNKEL